MKRTFFTLTAVLASALCFAQTTERIDVGTMQKVRQTKATSQVMTLKSKDAPKKSAATGNYYTRPAGTMYRGFDKEGMGYYNVGLVAPAYTDMQFTNMNADRSGNWYLNAQTGLVSADDMADADNNLIIEGGIQGGYYLPEPVLVNGSDSYKLPNRYGSTYMGQISTSYEITPLTYTDSHVGRPLNGWGILSSHYLYGAGTYNDPELGALTSIGVRQHYEKPISPLYVEDIYLSAVSNNGDDTPLKNGATLTMRITNDAGEEIAVLTAGAEDLTQEGDPKSDEYYGLAYQWNIVFTNKVEDPLSGTLVANPFVIDEAFNVEITGFDNPDVNLGLCGFQCAEEDPLEDADVLLSDGDEVYALSYTSANLALPMTFTGIFDYVDVSSVLSYYTDDTQTATVDIENCNVLRITDDGTSCYMDNEAGEPAAYVMTGADWYDDNQNENYYYEVASSSDGNGDWITSYAVDNTSWIELGYNFITFSATACPSGEGRWAVVNIVGRGVTSATPIILLQGTATLDDVNIPSGITNITTGNSNKEFDPNASVYNLEGQRVSKDAKGILIQNGRKFIRK